MWSSVYSSGSQNPVDCDPFLKLQDRANRWASFGLPKYDTWSGRRLYRLRRIYSSSDLSLINPSSVLICLPRKPRTTLENH
ncbi:hypothetical protein T02_13919 [Trichinella nativa]|uniref:Uncharacterized protein n=1 Tax=Trichinella nativa TaxID=6335 RepID=A0A0V1L7U6_9BILA|nr:hypothetical protein T02_13919 [Trichinella nativa]